LIDLTACAEAAPLGAVEVGVDRGGDSRGDFALQVRELAEPPLIVSGKEDRAVTDVQEFHVDRHAIARPLNRAGHDGIDVKVGAEACERPSGSLRHLTR